MGIEQAVKRQIGTHQLEERLLGFECMNHSIGVHPFGQHNSLGAYVCTHLNRRVARRKNAGE